MHKFEQSFEFVKLKGDVRKESRGLWEEVFSQDTGRFLDYYYLNKAQDAWVYLLKEHGTVVSMVHLNPYFVRCDGAVEKAYYIVGVATKKEYRHRGCMHRLLERAAADAKAEGCPFLFLMPADPAIYEPFGFRYGYAHQAYRPSGNWWLPEVIEKLRNGESCGIRYRETDYRIEPYLENDGPQLNEFAKKELEKRYRTFCIHDEFYFNRLKKELVSENGDLFLVWQGKGNDEELAGYFCYSVEEEEETYQEVVLAKGAQKLFLPSRKRDAIMILPLREKVPETPCYFPEIV